MFENGSGKPDTIWNVDADEAGRSAVTQALRRAGFEVSEAGTAAAMSGAAGGADLILLTLHPSDASGPEVCRRLKADPATAAVPVLVLAGGCKDSRCRVACFEAGAEGCLTRPVAADELAAQINTLLRLRRAERESRAGERRYRTLAGSAPVGIFETDAEGNCLFVNDRWCGMAGMTPEAARGRGWADALHPDDRDRIFREWYAAAGGGREFAAEYRFRTPGGRVTWLSGRAVGVRDEAGTVTGYVGTVEDITGLKDAESALRRSEARLATELEAMRRLHELSTRLLAAPDLRTALDEILDAAITMSRADMGNVQLHDPGAGALEIVAHRGFGSDFLEHFRVVHEKHGSACGGAMRGERVVIEDVDADPAYAPHRAAAAAAGYRAVQSTPLLSRDGRLLGVLSTHFRRPHRPSDDDLRVLDLYARQAADMIDRIRADEALHRASERLASLVGNTPLAVVEWDKEFRITRWSGGAERVFGWTAAEMVGQRIEAAGLVYDEDTGKVRETMGRLLDGKNRYVVSANRNRTKAGGVIDCEWNNSILSDEAGRMEAVLSLVLDVTDRKRAEAELREADRRKDEFLATLAHELRNPLAPLRNGLQVMKLAAGDPSAVEKARSMMERQLGQMVHLIDDLLDVSRITRGKLHLRRERVELAAVVQAAVEGSRPQVEASGHRLDVALPPGPVWVDADPTRLAQVLSNLLTNAAKYTDRGGRIELTAGRDGGGVVVSVRDTGIGIAPDHLPRVFEMFSQVDSALERSQGGLGIGLALVKGLVEMHGGAVEARSEGLGKGSEFVVRLPVAGGTTARETPLAPGVGAAVGPRRRILVADDNRDAADSLAMLLRLGGHEVHAVHDGQEAVEAAGWFRPDLALLDIGMPRLNGYEACRRIRAEPWGRRVVLVAITGWGQEDDRRRATEAGFDHHLTKPVDPAALENLLAASGAPGRTEARP